MATSRRTIWLWQRIVTPHMAGLAVALGRLGHPVTYIAEEEMSSDRAAQGWTHQTLPSVNLRFAPTSIDTERLAEAAPFDAVHICQGVRGNGLVGYAQAALARRGARQWVIMETVDDSGWRGVLKRLEYRRLFTLRRRSIEGLLTTGHRTSAWLAARGMPHERVYPFSYFLPRPAPPIEVKGQREAKFRVLFVGQHIHRKRLDLLITAMARLPTGNVELVVVGTGPLESELRTMAEALLPGRVLWIGVLPIEEVPKHMAQADCLVLPSRHDGWGAVVSEALMVGTPVICSDRCGAAGVVLASRRGGVFPSGDVGALTTQLQRIVDGGRQSWQQRAELADWAKCLGAEAGATYLTEILRYVETGGARPAPPWEGAGSARDQTSIGSLLS